MSQALTPYLTVSNAAAATEFYKRALGAEELRRHAAPDNTGRLMHVHLRIHGSDLMLADDFPDHMGRSRKPETLGGSPVTLHLQVEKDVDAIFAAALAAGATERAADGSVLG